MQKFLTVRRTNLQQETETILSRHILSVVSVRRTNLQQETETLITVVNGATFKLEEPISNRRRKQQLCSAILWHIMLEEPISNRRRKLFPVARLILK